MVFRHPPGVLCDPTAPVEPRGDGWRLWDPFNDQIRSPRSEGPIPTGWSDRSVSVSRDIHFPDLLTFNLVFF